MKFDRRQIFHPRFMRLTSCHFYVGFNVGYFGVIMSDENVWRFAQMTFHATFRIFPLDFSSNISSNISSNNEFRMLDWMLDSFAPALRALGIPIKQLSNFASKPCEKYPLWYLAQNCVYGICFNEFVQLQNTKSKQKTLKTRRKTSIMAAFRPAFFEHTRECWERFSINHGSNIRQKKSFMETYQLYPL